MAVRRGAVLVTGAGSGIGRAVALRLAAKGWPVFAAARSPAHLEELSGVAGVTPLPLDVRDEGAVGEAEAQVERSGRPLHGLVHAAGVGGIGYLHTFTDDELRGLFEVNVFGVVRVTRAFLPLLLRARGRVLLVGSQGGHIGGRFFGPYTMTKHALEACVLALHEELAPRGVRATLVDPGGVRTGIAEKSRAADRARFERAGPPFEEEARGVLEALGAAEAPFDPSRPESESNRNPCEPEAVAAVIEEALTAEDPPLRVLVGTEWEGRRVFRELARRMAQANRAPQHRHGRETLIAFLDEALAEDGG